MQRQPTSQLLEQAFLPARLLRGLLPDALLESHLFWQNGDGSLSGYPAHAPHKGGDGAQPASGASASASASSASSASSSSSSATSHSASQPAVLLVSLVREASPAEEFGSTASNEASPAASVSVNGVSSQPQL